MGETMCFPKTWKEFLHDYEFEDARRIYTNGSRLIPSFRVKQMMEHYLSEINAKLVEEKAKGDICAEVIKRQDKEIEKLRNAKVVFETVDYCSDDLHEALEDIDRLKAEVERLRDDANKTHYALQRANKYGMKVDAERVQLIAEVETLKAVNRELRKKLQEVTGNEYV